MSVSPVTQAPVLSFSPAQERKAEPETIASDHSLLEIDRELDVLSDQMQDELEATGVASPESVARFQAFCDAYGEKVDRIGRFLRSSMRSSAAETGPSRVRARVEHTFRIVKRAYPAGSPAV